MKAGICTAAKRWKFSCTHECLSRNFTSAVVANSLRLNQWSISKEIDQLLSLITFPSKLNSTGQTLLSFFTRSVTLACAACNALCCSLPYKHTLSSSPWNKNPLYFWSLTSTGKSRLEVELHILTRSSILRLLLELISWISPHLKLARGVLNTVPRNPIIRSYLNRKNLSIVTILWHVSGQKQSQLTCDPKFTNTSPSSWMQWALFN